VWTLSWVEKTVQIVLWIALLFDLQKKIEQQWRRCVGITFRPSISQILCLRLLTAIRNVFRYILKQNMHTDKPRKLVLVVTVLHSFRNCFFIMIAFCILQGPPDVHKNLQICASNMENISWGRAQPPSRPLSSEEGTPLPTSFPLMAFPQFLRLFCLAF